MDKELKRSICVLVAKIGLDGHDRGGKVIACFSDIKIRGRDQEEI